MRRIVIPSPLTIPHKAPITIGIKITTYQAAPAFEVIAKTMSDNINIDPTDKSIPAVTITIKTPKASIDCHEICLKTFVIFLQERKTSGCIKCNATIIIKSNSSIPYLSKYGMAFKKRLCFLFCLVSIIYFFPIIQPITSSRVVFDSSDSAKLVP